MNLFNTTDCTLKNGKMVNLMLCIFYQSKDTGRQQTPRTPKCHLLYQWRRRNSWILKQGSAKLDSVQDFAPEGTVGVFQIGYYQYYRNHVSKGNMLAFLWCWQLTCFSTTPFLTRNSNISGYASNNEEGPVWRAGTLCIADLYLLCTSPRGTQETWSLLILSYPNWEQCPIKDDWYKNKNILEI